MDLNEQIVVYLIVHILCLCECRAVREMVLAEPEIVNSRNDEECVPLHLSSGLNREEITLFLLSQVDILC